MLEVEVEVEVEAGGDPIVAAAQALLEEVTRAEEEYAVLDAQVKALERQRGQLGEHLMVLKLRATFGAAALEPVRRRGVLIAGRTV